MGVAPLVRGVSVPGAKGTLTRLASWRHRQMPMFPGTADERHALAVYLATLGGATPASMAAAAASSAAGARVFDERCSPCHGAGGPVPLKIKGRSVDDLYALIGRLPSVNDAMPAFDGTETERRALAEHLVTLDGAAGSGGAR
jgi:mono/diheme cytochrome c family protein